MTKSERRFMFGMLYIILGNVMLPAQSAQLTWSTSNIGTKIQVAIASVLILIGIGYIVSTWFGKSENR